MGRRGKSRGRVSKAEDKGGGAARLSTETEVVTAQSRPSRPCKEAQAKAAFRLQDAQAKVSEDACQESTEAEIAAALGAA